MPKHIFNLYILKMLTYVLRKSVNYYTNRCGFKKGHWGPQHMVEHGFMEFSSGTSPTLGAKNCKHQGAKC